MPGLELYYKIQIWPDSGDLTVTRRKYFKKLCIVLDLDNSGSTFNFV